MLGLILSASSAHAADLSPHVEQLLFEEWLVSPTTLPWKTYRSRARKALAKLQGASREQKPVAQANNGAPSSIADHNAEHPRKEQKGLELKAVQTTGDSLGYLIPLFLIVFAIIGVISVMTQLPRALRAFDRLFEPSDNDPLVASGRTEPVMSTEDYRSEIDALRTMKAELEAQAEAARATIREILARTNQQKDGAA